jgi:hypothetical protein
MRSDLPMQCDAEQTYETLVQMTRRNLSMSARYLAIVERRPFSEMRKTNEGRLAA